MEFNAFEYYEQMRKQQHYVSRIVNPESKVPTHQAYKPAKAKIEEARRKERLKKQQAVEHENYHIMKKLFSINKRKPKMSHSTPNLSLPPIARKPFVIPEHENENNIIAKKLIASKSSIDVKKQLREFSEQQNRQRNLRKFEVSEGGVINRKKYVAELMLLKKMRISENTESRVLSMIGANSRISKNSKPSGKNPEFQSRYYSNKH